MNEHRAGPIRSAAARESILAATAKMFQELRYDQLTIEGIAKEAGVGKQTIYRWWGSKGEIVAECMFEDMLIPGRLSPPDTGDIRADLVDWLGSIFRFIEEPGAEALMISLISAAAQNADVGRRLHESLGAGSPLTERLEAASEASQLPADSPLEEIGEVLVGAAILRALSRSPVDVDAANRLVATILGAKK